MKYSIIIPSPIKEGTVKRAR